MDKKQSYLVAESAIFVALAMIFSYVESLIPINFGVPGMKLGLANLVVVTGLYMLSWREVLLVSILRIILTGFLFGNGMSILYSLSGGLASFGVMLGLKKIGCFSMKGVSAAGGAGHNIGQLLIAACVVQNVRVMSYVPVLLVAGMVTGLLIGVIGGKIIRAIGKDRMISAIG